MSTLQEFAFKITRTGQRVEKNSNEIVKRAARSVIRSLILDTPVDVGTARSNWIMSLGGPSSQEIPAYSPGMHLGLAERANATAAIQAADLVISAKAPGQAVWANNNVDYIGLLNQGTSPQARPAGYVERAIQRGMFAIRGAQVLGGN